MVNGDITRGLCPACCCGRWKSSEEENTKDAKEGQEDARVVTSHGCVLRAGAVGGAVHTSGCSPRDVLMCGAEQSNCLVGVDHKGRGADGSNRKKKGGLFSCCCVCCCRVQMLSRKEMGIIGESCG